jgi:hypothetical protein
VKAILCSAIGCRYPAAPSPVTSRSRKAAPSDAGFRECLSSSRCAEARTFSCRGSRLCATLDSRQTTSKLAFCAWPGFGGESERNGPKNVGSIKPPFECLDRCLAFGRFTLTGYAQGSGCLSFLIACYEVEFHADKFSRIR